MLSPSTGPLLGESDFRDLVRLLGDVVACSDDITGKRGLLMSGLCRLTDADSWVWCVGKLGESGQVGAASGGRASSYIHATRSPATRVDIGPPAVSSRPAARRPPQPGSYGVESLNLGWLVVSERLTVGGGVSGLGVFRQPDAPAFTPREVRITEIVLKGVPWIHLDSFHPHRKRSAHPLQPRQRAVLKLLGEGWDRKKIAAEMGVSVNTIHGYAKAIFRHFGVHSQAELISRLMEGDAEVSS